MRRITFSLAAVAVLVFCSCAPADPPQTMDSEKGEPAPTATSPPTTTPAPTTTAPLGFGVPSTIDVPYVQRVVDELFRLEGEAARYIYAKKVPDAEFNARLEAILGEPALADAKTLYGRGAARGFDRFADPPGDPKAMVLSVVEATPTCILARAALDYRPLFKNAERTEPDGFVLLSPGDVLPLNRTGWGVVSAGKPAPGRELKAC